MDKQEKYSDDILKEFLSPDTKVKAPEGFTTNIMSRIMFEHIPATAVQKQKQRSIIPVVSAVLFTTLVIIAFLLGNSKENDVAPLGNFLKSLRFEVPLPDLSFLSKIVMPQWMVYLSISILFLTIFDKALYTLFKKEK